MNVDFETKVLNGVAALEKQAESYAKRFEDYEKQTKQLLEELTLVKNHNRDMGQTLQSLQRANRVLQYENIRDPLRRFSADPARVDWLLGCFNKAAGRDLTPAQKTAVTGIDTGLGQYTTPQETNEIIYDTLLTYGQWGTLGIVPIGSRTQILPVTTARPTAYWIASGAQITEGAITTTYVTQTIRENAAWIPVALGALDDSSADLASYLLGQLTEACAYRLDWACFAADGTDDSTDGAYTGIAVGGTAANAGVGNTEVKKLDLEDFVRAVTTVDAGVLQRPAKWWIHPQVIAKLCQIRDANDRPIFQTALEAPSSTIGSILGYPVVPTAAMPSTDSASKVIAVFGDPQAGAVSIRKSFDLASSDDFQFDYHRRCFKCVIRAGFIIRKATGFAMLTTAAA